MKSSIVKKVAEIFTDLSKDKQEELIDFAEYLKQKQLEQASVTDQVVESIRQVKNGKYRSARAIF